MTEETTITEHYAATTEQLAAAETLYQLAENLCRERANWRDERARRGLMHAVNQIERAAREALGHTEIWAEAWAEAGTLVLKAYVSQRRFVQSLITQPSRKPPRRRVTLDCRNGVHSGCVTCDCHCHG